jgi:hypothetical protein
VVTGEKVLFAVKTEKEASQLLELLVKDGATIHAVLPQRRTLEEHFLREVSKT